MSVTRSKPRSTRPSTKPKRDTAAATSGRAVARALMGGRVTKDTIASLDFTIGNAVPILIPPTDAESGWALEDLDTQSVRKMRPTRLMALLIELSPDVSRALWDFLRLCNPGYECHAYNLGSDDQPNAAAEVALQVFIDALHARYGSFDVVLNRLFLSGYLRGAFFAELVLDASGKMPIDLAVPDPASVRFKLVPDDLYGVNYIPCQWQGGKGITELDRPTVRYVPIDPLPGNPYGRAPINPSLFTTLFLIGLLHDLRRVVAQQGYPRLDIEVLLDKLQEQMPEGLKEDPEEYRQWVTAAITEVQQAYQALQPDSAWIHTDTVKVNRPVGAVDSSSLGGIDGLIKFLERQATRALKTMPLLMGSTEGTSEANANRQWELMAAGIKSLQHLLENMLGYLFELALRAQGLQANVVVQFAELRAAEMMRDEQTRRLRNLNSAFEEWMGWADHEEAAMGTVGHAPASPAPLVGPIGWGGAGGSGGGAGGGEGGGANPDPGSSRALRERYEAMRSRRLTAMREMIARYERETAHLKPSGSALGTVPDVDYSDEDIAAVLALWDEEMGTYAGLLDAEVVDG